MTITARNIDSGSYWTTSDGQRITLAAAEILRTLPDEEQEAYLAGLPTEVGSPAGTYDAKNTVVLGSNAERTVTDDDGGTGLPNNDAPGLIGTQRKSRSERRAA
jgi:hypothetical protein